MERRDKITVDNQTSFGSTYFPRCPRLEHAFSSSGIKIIYAGWVFYFPSDAPVRKLPLRQDLVYVMLLENIPKIYLARDPDQDMPTIDVSPAMRAEIKEISKSHGRGVVLRQDEIVHGRFVPFYNQYLVDKDKFEVSAYPTIAPFPHNSHAAATHLMCVMDSWMMKMYQR